MKDVRSFAIQAILMIVLIIGTAFGSSSRYVSTSTFKEFKDGTINALWKKIDKMDEKLDFLVRQQNGHSTKGKVDR